MYAPDTEIRIEYTFRSKRYFFVDFELVLIALLVSYLIYLSLTKPKMQQCFHPSANHLFTLNFVGHSFRVKVKLGTFLPTHRWAF